MKKMKIKGLVSILIDIILLSLVYFLFPKNGYATLSQLKFLSMISFLISLYIVINSFFNNKNVFEFYKVFLLFYIIYIFGIVYLRYIFNYESSDITMYLDYLISNSTLYHGILYSTCTLLAIDIGYRVFFYHDDIENIRIDDLKDLPNSNYIKTIGFFLFFISIAFALKELVETIKLVGIYGYKGQIENVSYGISSIESQIVPFFMISIYLLVIGYRDNKTKRNIFFLIGSLYSISLIFLGRRGLPLLRFLGLVIIFISITKKIKFKTLIKIVVALLVISTFISVIRENRDKPFNEWGNNLLPLIVEKIQENPINESIYEMGLGIYPISYSMKLVPRSIPSLNGKSYLYAFINAFKFNFSNSKQETENYNCGEIIAKYEGYQFGSSFIEEVFCNFRWYGILFCTLIGYLIAYFSKLYNKQKNIMIKVLMISFFVEFIWCIKNVLYNLPRIFLLYFLPIVIMYIILCSRRGTKEVRE